MKRATPEEVTYPAGWFTEPCRAWWGESWRPFLIHKNAANTGSAASQRAMQTRERLMAEGVASAAGTMSMPGTPKGLGPKQMMRNGKGGRQYGDKVAGFFFRGQSIARTAYSMLMIEGEMSSILLASRLGMPASKLKDHLHAAREAGVIVSRAISMGRVAYAVGTQSNRSSRNESIPT